MEVAKIIENLGSHEPYNQFFDHSCVFESDITSN